MSVQPTGDDRSIPPPHVLLGLFERARPLLSPAADATAHHQQRERPREVRRSCLFNNAQPIRRRHRGRGGDPRGSSGRGTSSHHVREGTASDDGPEAVRRRLRVLRVSARAGRVNSLSQRVRVFSREALNVGGSLLCSPHLYRSFRRGVHAARPAQGRAANRLDLSTDAAAGCIIPYTKERPRRHVLAPPAPGQTSFFANNGKLGVVVFSLMPAFLDACSSVSALQTPHQSSYQLFWRRRGRGGDRYAGLLHGPC